MRTVLRGGLLGFAAVELVLGVWTLVFPASFYADVPTVDLTPPFSEHLMRDFGGATLGQGKRLFGEGTVPRSWRLTAHKVSSTGVLMCTYERAGEVETGTIGPE